MIISYILDFFSHLTEDITTIQPDFFHSINFYKLFQNTHELKVYLLPISIIFLFALILENKLANTP